MASIFHSSPVLLAPGSIVLPGNYGRIIRHVGPAHSHYNREMILEHVRAQHFDDKPSRLESCFACITVESARFYMNTMAGKPGSLSAPVLYEVEKVDPGAPDHRADFNVVQPLPRRSETMEEIAHLYWRAALWCDIAGHPGLRCEEVVTTSPLRILRRL
jgi:hypothetical protein